MKTRSITLRFPVGGLVKRHAFQTQPPYTTPDALNVWPVGPTDLRQRGARRAGLEKMATGSAGATQYRCLIPVPKVVDGQYEYRLMCAAGDTWYYPVAGGAMTEWVTGGLATSTGRVPWVVRNSKVYYLDGSTLKIMDPYAPSLANVVATEGAIPSDCDMLRMYRDRLVMARKRAQVWYMSEQSDFAKWDYTKDSDITTRAVYQGTHDSGKLAGPLNAVCPAGKHYCVFGLDNELWILHGDPAFGGEIKNLSRQIGIIGDDAWCFTPEGDLLFLDWSGLWMAPKGGGEPVPFSQEKLPRDLWNIDPGSYDVVLRYDAWHQGFLLSVLPLTGASQNDPGEHWWIDWPLKSIWKLEFPYAKAPRFLEQFAWTAGYDHILAMGCEDGVLRMFDDDATTDDGTDVTAYCSLGPFRTGGNDYQDGMVRELIGTMGKDSADVTWRIYVDADAEAAVTSSTVFDSDIWSGGRNHSVHPRARGGAAVLQLHGTGLWEFESCVAVLKALGKQRL